MHNAEFTVGDGAIDVPGEKTEKESVHQITFDPMYALCVSWYYCSVSIQTAASLSPLRKASSAIL